MSRRPNQAVAALAVAALAVALSGCGGARTQEAPDVDSIASREIMPAAGGEYLPEPTPAPAAGAPVVNPDQPVSSVPDAAPTPPPKDGAAPGSQVPAPPDHPNVAPPSADKTPDPTPLAPGVNMPEMASFHSLEQGTNSGVETQSVVLFRNQSDWTPRNGRPAPQVDFSRESVIGLFLGQKSSGGYGVTVTQVVVQGNVITVHAQMTSPAPGSMVTMAVTTPFHLVSIPRVGSDATVQVQWH